MATSRLCSIPDCGNTYYARGWCQAHYTRQRRYGDPVGVPSLVSSQRPKCSIDGCKKPVKNRSWCSAHYHRWQRYGDPLRGYTAQGVLPAFIEATALPCSLDGCLEWPFGKGKYPKLNINGKTILAHRYVCLLSHGPAPDRKHQAAHNCGNSRCVNPRHLRWATPAENNADKVLHGTILRGENSSVAKLTESQVIAIRSLLSEGNMTQKEIASTFGIDQTTVSDIKRRKNWSWL